MKNLFSTCCLAILFSFTGLAQDGGSLLDLVEDDEPQEEFASASFKSSRIIMTHSIENISKGVLDFRILHRFGIFTNGFENLFGLDQASVRIAFDYGLTDRLMIGFGRSGFRKEIDGFVKYQLLRQQSGYRSVPVTVSIAAGTLVKTFDGENPFYQEEFANRLAYYQQILIGRKFNKSLTLQLTPTILHENLVKFAEESNTRFALGIGGRLKVTDRIALMADYHYMITDLMDDALYNPLSVGVDIETGGHVFQLHFTNSIGLSERAYLTETRDNWSNFDFRFGWNLSRSFQIVR